MTSREQLRFPNDSSLDIDETFSTLRKTQQAQVIELPKIFLTLITAMSKNLSIKTALTLFYIADVKKYIL